MPCYELGVLNTAVVQLDNSSIRVWYSLPAYADLNFSIGTEVLVWAFQKAFNDLGRKDCKYVGSVVVTEYGEDVEDELSSMCECPCDVSQTNNEVVTSDSCLLYTSDAADE